MKVFTLADYYNHQLAVIYDAEKRWALALSALIVSAPTLPLQMMLRNQAQIATYHVRRLQVIFNEIDASPDDAECRSMRGHIEDALDVATIVATNDVRGIAVAAAAQQVEHLEIALYDEVIQLAAALEYVEHMHLLDDSLNEHHEAAFRFGAFTQPFGTAASFGQGGAMTIRDLENNDADALREHARDDKTMDLYDEILLGAATQPRASTEDDKDNKPRKPARKEQDAAKNGDPKSEPLVKNINDGDGVDPNKDDKGVDNIDDDDSELKEDMKGDSLGGTTQLPEQAADDDKELPQRSG